MPAAPGSHERSTPRPVLVSAWRHAELSRVDQPLRWGVVEEHWAGPIDDAAVYRDFGEEPWRRWDEMLDTGLDHYEPRMTMLVTRLVLESALRSGWSVASDERERVELERAGERVAAWSEPGSWLRLGADGTSWFETNDLAAIERVLNHVVTAGHTRTAADSNAARPGTARLEWGTGSWLEFTDSCPLPPALLERIIRRPLHRPGARDDLSAGD